MCETLRLFLATVTLYKSVLMEIMCRNTSRAISLLIIIPDNLCIQMGVFKLC